DQRGGQPERAVQARLLARPEQIEKERRGDEEAHPFAVEADLEGVKLDLRQPRECRVEIALEKRVVEEAVLLDLLVDAVRVQMRMAELAEGAESNVVRIRHRDGDDDDGDEVADQLRESS